MAKLRADIKNYKKAFTTHFQAYKNWNGGSHNSKRIIMCYCVECGLKCLIMQDNKICFVSQADPTITKVLGSHDFRVLLNAVKKAGIYRFENFQTEYDETVTPENYHQLCRYHINVKDGDMEPMNNYDRTLDKSKRLVLGCMQK